jgi:hypothetical protein
VRDKKRRAGSGGSSIEAIGLRWLKMIQKERKKKQTICCRGCMGKEIERIRLAPVPLFTHLLT